MKPDRSNYEIWLIDWLDGNLNDSRVAELMEFLDANPDLREEADSLSFPRLYPSEKPFEQKEKLIKNAKNLHHTQIEYLSVAWLENDISVEQADDIKQCIDNNPAYKTIFESFQKIRLKPGEYRYRDKFLLKKQSLPQKIFRLSVIGLSAAATITLIVLSNFFAPQLNPEINDRSAQVINVSATPSLPFIVRTKVFKERQEMVTFSGVQNITTHEPATEIALNEPGVRANKLLTETDSSLKIKTFPVHEIFNIPVRLMVNNNGEKIPGTLIATNNTFTLPLYDERSRFSKFLARTFREKILKEDVVSDAPVRSYEIAEAGIDGLNKIFGWDMALVRTTDEAGEIKSVYFSSKVLKFNAPIKKSEVSR